MFRTPLVLAATCALISASLNALSAIPGSSSVPFSSMAAPASRAATVKAAVVSIAVLSVSTMAV